MYTKKTGTEFLLTAVIKDTHWEEHARQLEGEISACILQKLRQFGNLCQAELDTNILMI